MKKYLLIIAVCLPLLTGCGFLTNFLKPTPPEVAAVTISPKLLEPCDLLVKTPINTPDDALLETIDLYRQYGICARKQDDSVKALKQLSGDKNASK